MIDENILKQFREIDLKRDLKIEKNNLTYDYSHELWEKINDVYSLINEAINYIIEKTPSEFTRNIENSINNLIDILQQIKKSQDYLWNNFDWSKTNIIYSINTNIDQIFAFQDWAKLLPTLNYLKNDYFAKNAEKISSDMFEKWASWKDKWINSFITMIEEKAKESLEKAKEKAEQSSSVLQEVNSLEWLEEIKNYQIQLSGYYENEKKLSFWFILWISSFFLIYLIWLKFWWFVDYDKFNLWWYYMYSQIIIWFVILSLFWYLLRLSVDQFKLSSNIFNNLKHKWNIINSYKLLFRTDWSETEKIELNKLIIEKTTENLFKLWDWTHYSKDEKIDTKIYDKLIDILPKLK